MIVLFNDLEPRWVQKNVADLDVRLFGDQAWGRDVIRREITDASRMYIADVTELHDSQRVIMRGFAGIWMGCANAEILTIGVDKKYRRQGIAGRMLDCLIDYARLNDTRRIGLEVSAGNQAARSLYRSRGFEDIAILPHYYESQGEDGVKMVLDLKEHIMGFSATGSGMEQEQ